MILQPTMSHTTAAIGKARASASAFKSKNRRAAGDGRKTLANCFNDKPEIDRRCSWNQPVTAAQNKNGEVTFTCPCGHKSLMRLDSCNDIYFDGLTKHNETHQLREPA